MGRRKKVAAPVTPRAVPVQRSEVQQRISILEDEVERLRRIASDMASNNLSAVKFDGAKYVDRGIQNVRAFRIRLAAAVEESGNPFGGPPIPVPC